MADPNAFAKGWDWCGQDLLNVVEEAYEEITGETWECESPVNYETGSNSEAW